MRIHITEIPYDVAVFHIKLQNYLLERNAHRLTQNVPAPFPEHEILRVIAERIETGESVEIYDDRPPHPVTKEFPSPPTQTEIDARKQELNLITRIIPFIA